MLRYCRSPLNKYFILRVWFYKLNEKLIATMQLYNQKYYIKILQKIILSKPWVLLIMQDPLIKNSDEGACTNQRTRAHLLELWIVVLMTITASSHSFLDLLRNSNFSSSSCLSLTISSSLRWTKPFSSSLSRSALFVSFSAIISFSLSSANWDSKLALIYNIEEF